MENRNVEIIRSRRKTLSVQIKPDATIVVRAPLHLHTREIRAFLTEKSEWIEKHVALVLAAKEAGESAPISGAEIRALTKSAKAELPIRVEQYARYMGVSYGKITIRHQKGRWGSCAANGNLNFNCLLMLAPEYVRDYVIVHELAHRKQMNHSADFWKIVALVLPDYKAREKWLKTEGKILLQRMRSGENEE